MSLLEKVKNFFYDDEYEEEDEKEIPKIKPKEKIKIKKEKHVFEEPKREEQKISERELFKAERTFNFPMDVEDENDFIVEEKPKIIQKEEVKPIEKPKTTSYDNIRTYAKYEEKKEERNEPKKFKPTPVISPIYGVLDKNYTKEDLVIDSTVKQKPVKKVDYDTVRKRAYSNVYSNEEDEKSIFFNLDEQTKKEEKKDDDEVKIIYNDVTLDDEKDESVTIGQKMEAYEKSISKDVDFEDDDEDATILSETKEQDLFNLIDNMYNSEEDDEEDE